MEEIWKDIEGLESYYQVSNLGRMKIKERTYTTSTGVVKKVGEKIKVPNKNGFLNLGTHPYDIRTLLFRYFPSDYINRFIKENTLDNEEWKDVKGYEGYYKVSSFGRVMSLPRIMGSKEVKGTITPSCTLGRILKPCIIGKPDKSGIYRQSVILRKDGTSTTKLLNRLVAETFIPNPDNLPEVNHINRDILDNTVKNLEWVSKDFNIQHSLLKREALVAIYKLALKENTTPSELIIKLVSNYTH